MANPFSPLITLTNDRNSRFGGFLPSLSTAISLILMSSIIALVPVLLSSFALTLSGVMSALAFSALSVTAISLVNHWFAREIQFYTLKCKPVKLGQTFDKRHKIDLFSMVNHLCQELNAFDGTEDPAHPNHLKVPRLATFRHTDARIVCVPGRNISASALYISTGMFDHKETYYTQKEIAALIMAELVRIKHQRDSNHVVLNIVEGLSQTLRSLISSVNPLLQLAGIALGPLNLSFLLHNAVSRSHYYEAARVVVECGRGQHYRKALDRGGNPFYLRKQDEPIPDHRYHLEVRPDYVDSQRFRGIPLIGASLNQLLNAILRPFYNFVKDHELPTDDIRVPMWQSFADICLREGATVVKELFANKPKGTFLKEYIDHLRSAPDFMDTFCPIPEGDKYAPIDPEQSQVFKSPHKLKKQKHENYTKLEELLSQQGPAFSVQDVQNVLAPQDRQVRPVQYYPAHQPNPNVGADDTGQNGPRAGL